MKTTFGINETIKELWIDVNRKFEVIRSNFIFDKGDILTLTKDDNSVNPFFTNQEWKQRSIHLCNLAYYDEIKPWDLVWISDETQESADNNFINDPRAYYVWKSKNWWFVVEFKDKTCCNWKFISNKSKEKNKVTLELTDEQIEQIKDIIK